MSAQFVDALKGYEYFLETRGKASRKDVNNFLSDKGRRTISQRTYGHYQKLLSNGFRGYIPINKFDVFQSLGRIQIAADRRRYERRDVSQPVRISRDQDRWTEAIIIDRSIVGFGLLITKKYPIRPGTQLWIDLEGYKPIPLVVVWRDHEQDQTRMGLRAFEFIAKYRLSDEKALEPRRTGSIKVFRQDDDELTWSNAYRVFEKIDEMLESAEDLLISIDDVVQSGVRIANPVIESIHFGSPGDAQFKVDFGIADIIRVITEKVQLWREQKRRFSAETDQVELENANLQVELLRKAIHISKEAYELGISEEIISELLGPVLLKALGVEELPEELFSEGSLELAILQERLLPAATELLAGDDLGFNLDVEESEEEKFIAA
jgi:hypothetical protein